MLGTKEAFLNLGAYPWNLGTFESEGVVTSDINYLELGSTSQNKGTILHKTALPSDTRHQFGGPQTSWLQIWEFSLSVHTF